MIRNINRLFSSLLVVGLALYVVFMNRQNVTVHLTPGVALNSDLGIVIIAIYALGIVSATLVAVYFGIKGYLRERSLKLRDKNRQSFYLGMVQARGFAAGQDWKRAEEHWEQILDKDPTHIISRIELSRCLEGKGELLEALRVLDKARAASPQNVEVLFRAAELNIALNNKTAAIDNLALILAQTPSVRAARLGRDLSEQLDRLEDAFEYQKKLEEMSACSGEESQQVRSRLEYRKIVRDSKEDTAQLIVRLREYVRKNSAYAPALARLAELEAENGAVDSAAQLLLNAARVSGEAQYWKQASRLWLTRSNPERSLAAARAATKEAKGSNRLAVELELIRIYISLNMLEDAQKASARFSELAKEQKVEIPADVASSVLALGAIASSRLGDNRSAEESLKKLSEQDFSFTISARSLVNGNTGNAPSPTLSTP